MAFSFQQYVGDGVTTLFNVPFPYLLQSDVTVKVNNVVTAYTWNTSSQISVVPAPVNGAVVEVRRSSNRSTLNVNFQDGSVLGKLDLNNDGTQLLYIAQEAFDAASNALQLASDATFDATNDRIKNVANPLNAQDAATKSYVDALAVGTGNVPAPGSSNGGTGWYLKSSGVASFTWAQLNHDNLTDVPQKSTSTGVGEMLRIKTDKTGFEFRTPTQVRGDLGLGNVAVEAIGQGLEDDGAGNLRVKLDAINGGVARGAAGITLDASFLRGFLSGLVLSNDGVSPNTVIDVSAGVANSDDNTFLMKTSAFTKNCNAAWAVGSGNGALDSGSALVANTWYHLFQIGRTDTGVVDFLLSASATAPTMPTNYTKKRRLGAIRTDASAHIMPFVQNGDEFIWGVEQGDFTTSTLGTASTLFSFSYVPSSVKVNALFRAVITNAAAGALVILQSADEPAIAGNALPGGDCSLCNAVASVAAAGAFNLRTNTSAQVRAASSLASTTLNVAVYGWLDTRGRFA